MGFFSYKCPVEICIRTEPLRSVSLHRAPGCRLQKHTLKRHNGDVLLIEAQGLSNKLQQLRGPRSAAEVSAALRQTTGKGHSGTRRNLNGELGNKMV